ncbi:MAG: leucine-rich repeat domain-containing protein [Acetatifactor sp.]
MFENNMMGLIGALGMEAFVSIHMSIFVLSPLAGLIAPKQKKKVFWIMFWIRVAVLLFFDLFITTGIAMVDFMAVFVGAFILVPLKILKSMRGRSNIESQLSFVNVSPDPSKTNPGTTTNIETIHKTLVRPTDFDPIFSLPEEECIESFLKREMNRTGITDWKGQIPAEVLRRKNILNAIFAVLLYLFVAMIFFHFPVYIYVLGLVLLVVYSILTNRYKLMNYLKKEVKSRPQEKISNIVMNVKVSLVPDNSGKIKAVLIAAAIVGALLTFVNPRIMYEKAEDGYYVRFYTFGLTNMTEVEIPDSYEGEKVVGLRGNTFSNMPFLKEVTLPNTITDIHGQAFKNCLSLRTVELPRRLENLGGGAFYRCVSLESIELPDTLTALGGESFYGCTSLTHVKLSEGLTEIRGNTFENCSALTGIEIPDGVVRIGGHAFYGNRSLSEVIISRNSSLREIGSSAFRRCDSLEEIMLPQGVSIDERAFKETYARISFYGE